MICSRCRKAPVKTLHVFVSARKPTLAALVPSGGRSFDPGLEYGKGTADHGVKAARSQTRNFASSERTNEW